MAAAAIMGLNKIPNVGYKIPAATGIPSTLYINAKNKFCLIFFIVPTLRARALTIPIKSP